MVRYWWVNHKQTVRQEVDGQYLWSPKTRADGRQTEFYNNMRRASPGDIVLSYANQVIRYVGRVAEFAISAPKPEEFRNVGENWNQDGWLLPVYWEEFHTPIAPRLFINQLRRWLPERYSPINPETGHGNQNAYLAEIPKEAFDLLASLSAYNYQALAIGGVNSLAYDVVIEDLEDRIERKIRDDITLEDTERLSIIAARRGQGKFRDNLESVETACRLTGVTNPVLLIASHIKPWRACGTAYERLDGMNGLLLTPDADRLFDRGFISFSDEGKAILSPRADRSDLIRLGFEQLVSKPYMFGEAPMIWGGTSFRPEQQHYLAYHRSQVFLN